MRLNNEIKRLINQALKEDLGKKDVTTLFTIDPKTKVKAAIIAKEKGILCGIEIAKGAFPKGINFKILKRDGALLSKNQRIAILEGDAQKILTCERIALNFLSRLSGIATLTDKFVQKTKGTKACLLDTRKTTPTLRKIEKYAVRVGGGVNHRGKLDEAILIKDNHLRAAKFLVKGKMDSEKIGECIKNIRRKTNLKIEIEVESINEFKSVAKYRPDVVMLDNFNPSTLIKAVKFRNQNYPKIKLEASGGINLNNIKGFAKTGVDFISVGSITHSAPAIDFSLEIINGKS